MWHGGGGGSGDVGVVLVRGVARWCGAVVVVTVVVVLLSSCVSLVWFRMRMYSIGC